MRLMGRMSLLVRAKKYKVKGALQQPDTAENRSRFTCRCHGLQVLKSQAISSSGEASTLKRHP